MLSGIIVSGCGRGKKFNGRRVLIDVLSIDSEHEELVRPTKEDLEKYSLDPDRRYVWLDNEYHLPWRKYDTVIYVDQQVQPVVLITTASWYFREWVQSRSKELWSYLYSTVKIESQRWQFLCDLSVDYARYRHLSRQIRDTNQNRKLLLDWYQQLMRGFQLLGLSSDVLEAVNREPNPWSIYLSLISSPWTILYIDDTVYLWLIRCLKLKVPEEEHRARISLMGVYRWISSHGPIHWNDVDRNWPNVKYLREYFPRFGLVERIECLDISARVRINAELEREIGQRQYRSVDRWNIEPPDALNEQQRGALEMVSRCPVSCMLGPAGTGKTTVISEMKNFTIVERPCRILLTSFTGKACRRLSEVCQCPAKTIHLLLYKHIDPVDLVVVDEVSMVSPSLLLRLLKRLPEHVRLVLVGDFAQLPPIGEPSIEPIIESLDLPSIQLTECYRSNRTIFDNCQTLRTGSVVMFKWDDKFIHRRMISSDPITELVSDWSKMSYHHDFKVITPYREAAEQLNSNFDRVEELKGTYITDEWGTQWFLGEKVMFTYNNYQFALMNGDEGVVIAVDKNSITVEFEPMYDEGEEVKRVISFETNGTKYCGYYEGIEIKRLNSSMIVKSSAITVHKSQGSEWSEVWFYLPYWSSFITRQLVYTALTRARERIVIYTSLTAEEFVQRLNNQR